MPGDDGLDRLRTLVERLSDRADIAACIYRYTRGVDRMDADLILSAFHSDAVYVYSVHGTMSPQEFVDQYRVNQVDRLTSQHWVSNLTVDVDNDVAHCESYFMGVLTNKASDAIDVHGGRYIDKLERRDGVWRIAIRKSVPEWHVVLDGSVASPNYGTEIAELLAKGAHGGRRDRTDMSYDRPLVAPN
jgi:hypothetical protein